MTRQVIEEAKANSDKKAYQQLYKDITYMLNKGPASLEGTQQVYFNLAGMDVLFDIWARYMRNGTAVAALRKEVALQKKEIYGLKRTNAKLAAVDVEYLQESGIAYKEVLNDLLLEIRQKEPDDIDGEPTYIPSFNAEAIEQVVDEMSKKGYLP